MINLLVGTETIEFFALSAHPIVLIGLGLGILLVLLRRD